MSAAAASPDAAGSRALAIQGLEGTRRVALLSVVTAVLLSGLKIAGWLASGSVGLLASLADSGLDIAAALGTLTAVRYAAQPPDAEHRYGHGKAEAFASLLQAALVFASAALIAREAVARLMRPQPVHSEWLSLGIMVISTVVAALLVLAQSQVLKTARSVAVEGDRAHYMADVASNLVAFVGIGLAALFGAPRADAGAGLIVVALLVWSAIGMLKGAADNLMDRELDEDDRALILKLIYADPQVIDVHDFRTRASGPIIHIQAHVAMPPDHTIELAHRILVQAEGRILTRFPSADILLQPDPHGRAEPHAGAFAAAVRDGGGFDAKMTSD
jgi:ferrous-iron efflux pump FieF